MCEKIKKEDYLLTNAEIEEFYPILRKFIYYRFNAHEFRSFDADDVINECFIKFNAKFKYRNNGRPLKKQKLNYLHEMVKNQTLDWLEKHNISKTSPDLDARLDFIQKYSAEEDRYINENIIRKKLIEAIYICIPV